jgi:hypothetical protein
MVGSDMAVQRSPLCPLCEDNGWKKVRRRLIIFSMLQELRVRKNFWVRVAFSRPVLI